MKTTKKELDYQGQTIYVGIDVHKKQWKITIIIGGIRIKTYSMDSNPEHLVKYLTSNYPNGRYVSVYEAGFSGYWIDRQLRACGIENIIVNPADVPTSNKDKTRKTDIIDSIKLAKELSCDNLTGIYIPDKQAEAFRCLSRLRMQYTKDQTRIKNRIKSLLHFTGIKFPEDYEIKHWSGAFIAYLDKIDCGNAIVRTVLSELLITLKQIKQQIAKVLKELKKYVSENEQAAKIVKYLLTVPGVGFITATTFFAEVVDIKRFKHLDDLSSYVGLIPTTNSSGENDRVGKMSKRQNVFLRCMIIESSWVAIRQDPALTLRYAELTKKMRPQEAIIRIAKKLLNRIMYVWKNEQEYKKSVA